MVSSIRGEKIRSERQKDLYLDTESVRVPIKIKQWVTEGYGQGHTQRKGMVTSPGVTMRINTHTGWAGYLALGSQEFLYDNGW